MSHRIDLTGRGGGGLSDNRIATDGNPSKKRRDLRLIAGGTCIVCEKRPAIYEFEAEHRGHRAKAELCKRCGEQLPIPEVLSKMFGVPEESILGVRIIPGEAS